MVWLRHGQDARHLVVDVSVAGVALDSMLAHASTPGYSGSKRAATKLSGDAASSDPVAARHQYVPFVLETGGRLDEHARTLLYELAHRAVRDGRLPPSAPPRARPGVLVSAWVSHWLQCLSMVLHFTRARLLRDALALDAHFSPGLAGPSSPLP